MIIVSRRDGDRQRERETFVFVCTFEFYLNEYMYVVSFTQMGRVNLCIVRFGSVHSARLGSARLHCLVETALWPQSI